jgi:ribosome modulation factor
MNQPITTVEITQPAIPSAAYEEGRLAWHNGLLPDECPYLTSVTIEAKQQVIDWLKGWSDVSRSDSAYLDDYFKDFSGEGC